MTNRPDRDRIAPGRFVICHWSFVIFQEIKLVTLPETLRIGSCAIRSTWRTQSSEIGQVRSLAGTAMPRSYRGTGVSPVNDCAVRRCPPLLGPLGGHQVHKLVKVCVMAGAGLEFSLQAALTGAG